MNNIKTQSIKYGLSEQIKDIGMLVKFRLTFFVVFSSAFAYLIVAAGNINWLVFSILSVGGFLVAGAANALNQILEREYDRNMERTANRPLAAERMNVSNALVLAGFMCLFGIMLLALINPICAFLSMLSLIIYSFIYTPMKRFNTLSVAVGAIPGALPMMIGVVAFEGELTMMAFILFAIQFLWQFPHFWAIGYLSFDQYKNAGYKLLPELGGKVDPSLGLHSFVYSIVLIGIVILAWASGYFSAFAGIGLLICSIGYAVMSWRFHKSFDKPSALQLMFSSFIYLPAVLTILFISNI